MDFRCIIDMHMYVSYQFDGIFCQFHTFSFLLCFFVGSAILSARQLRLDYLSTPMNEWIDFRSNNSRKILLFFKFCNFLVLDLLHWIPVIFYFSCYHLEESRPASIYRPIRCEAEEPDTQPHRNPCCWLVGRSKPACLHRKSKQQ